MNHISAKEAQKNPTLEELVEPDNDLKNMLVEYVGEKLSPESGEITVAMIVDVLADEFPEFIMVLAEENWIRGYHQALSDVEEGEKMVQKTDDGNE
mgnify:CR=1 FL=1